MKVKLKKAVVIPANIQEVADRVAATPFDELASVLQDFKWSFDKGDINHWVAVLDHFDSFFEQRVAQRSDVQMQGDVAAEDPPFPTEACLAVLSATCVLLENCSNKAAYNSSEHLSNLLAAPVPEVAAAALQTFQVLVRKTHHTSARWTPPAGLAQRLLSLSKGWGGKEEGLDLVVCASSDEAAIKKVLQKVTTLHFEFSSSGAPAGAQAEGSSSRALTTIHVPNLDSFTEGEHQILAELVRRYKVPQAQRFELLCRIRIARGFGTLAGRRQLVKQRLLAFNVLLQCSPTAEEYNALYLAEPEFVSELVGLVQAEEAVPEEALRTLALRALAAQLHDRSRISSVIAAVTSGGQSGLLSMLLHKSIASILQQADVPLAPSGSGVLPADVAASAAAAAAAAGPSSSGFAAAASSGGAAVPAAAAAAPPVGSVAYSVAFVDALLSVVAALVQSSSGYQALNDAGVVAALLPLMRDLHPEHLGLVCTNLRILEAYMDLSQSAATMFRDLGGLTEMIKRLAYEVGVLSPPGGQQQAAAAAGAGAAGGARTAGDSDEVMASAEQPSPAGQQQQQGQAAGGGDAVTAAVPVKQLSHHRKVLLKYLLRIIAIGSYSPNGNVAPTRPQDDDAQLLFASLKAMYTRPEEFGGSLFSLAVSVMTDLIHHEPQSFRQLNEAGLPDAFLAAIKAGVLPSGDAVVSIPSALVALCLNTAGLKRVRETAVLNVLIDIFTSRKTQRVLTSDTPAVLGSGLEELLRFVPSLRGDGIDVVIGVFKALCILGGDEEEIAAALKPLPPEAPAEAEAAAAQPAAEPAASHAGSSGQQAPATAAAAEAPQPMDTDAPAAGAVAPAAAAGEQPAAAASGDAQQGAEAGADAAAGVAAGAAPAADGMDVDQPAAPAAQPDAADATAPQPAAAEGAAAAEPAAAAGGDAAAAAPTTPAATAAAQQAAEREREREQQRLEDARLSAVAKRALAESLQAVTKRRDLDAEMDAFLPGALTAASRMLEPLLTNAETSRQFVERGGTDVLLKIYQLPKLTPQFNFSSASHSLLSVFRALSGTHGQAIAARSKDAVAQQVALLLPMAQAVGPVCVPLMAPEARDKYIKQVLVVQGLVALTSAVARNVTAMLPQVSMGSPPLLASMGKLERMVMVQVAASDPWKQARDVAKKAAAAAAAAGATDAAAAAGGAAEAAGAVAAGAAAPEAPAAAAEEAGPVGDADAVDAADAAGAADDDMDGAAGDGAAAPEAADAPAAAVSSASPSKAKRPPEDIAYDGISFLLTSLRTFYMGTAKAVHSPARRREEQAAVPGVPMKAAALNLAALLVGNFQLQPWQQYDEAAEAKAGFAACSVSLPSSSKPGSEQVEAAALVIRSRSGHYVRLTEELNQVLFDNRRRYCHLLVLNYFAALGGMKVFASAFHSAAAMLWELLDAEVAAAQASTQQGTAAATSDQTMTDVQPSTGSTGGAGSSAAVAAVAAGSGPSASSLKDPRAVVEAVLIKMLAIYEQLANANMLLAVPQAVNMLLAPLPNYAGQPLVPPAKEPLHFVQQLHSDILAAVLPLWSHPQAAYVPAGVLTALVRVLQTCAQGPSHATLVLRYSQGRAAPAAARVQPQLDPALVQQIVDMGFSQARAEEALRRVGASSIELAMDWLFTHPEEPAAPAAPAVPAAGEGAGAGGPANAAAAAAAEADREEEELTRALLASLSVVGMSPDAVVQRSQQQASAQQQQQPAAAGQPSDATVNTAEPGSPVASTAHTGADAAAAAAGAATPAAAGGAAAADADEVTTPQRTPVPVVQPGAPVLGVAPAAAAVGTAVEAAGESSAESASTGIPAPAQLVDGAIHLVAASPSAAFSIADLLVTMATCEDGKDRAALVARLMDECLPPSSSSSSSGEAGSSAAAAAAAEFPPPGKDVLTPARLLLLLLHKDQHSRRVAGSKGLSQRALSMLQGWQGKYSAGVAAYEQSAQQRQPGDASSLQVPVWVEAILLLLGMMATTQPKPSDSRAQARQARSREAAAAAARFDAEVAVQDAAARVFAAAVRRAAAGPGAAGEQDAQMAVDQPAAAAAEQQPGGEAAAGPAAAGGAEAGAAAATPAEAAAAPAAGPAQAGGAAPAAAPATAAAAGGGSGAGALPQELARLPGLDTVLDNWKPCGMLDDAQQQGAMSFGLKLLQQLHDHADKWEQADHSMYEADASLPNPGALTQALLQLLDHLTKRFCNAQLLLGAGGHRLLLSLPSACLSPTISRQEGAIGSILRHLLEDPSTLEGWMESEIKNSMALKGQHGMRDPYTGRSLYNQANPFSRYTSISAFLQMMSALVQREPAVFLQAVACTCTLDANRGESMIRLKSARELQQPPATQAAPASAAAGSREGAAAAAAGTSGAGTSGGGADAAATAAAGEAAAEQPAPGLTTPKPAQPEQRDSGTGEKGAAAPRSAAKPHKKLVPSNFVEVIDALLDVVMGYNGITQQQQQQTAAAAAEPAAMELDAQSPQQQQQAGQQGATVAATAAAAAAQPAAAAAAAGAGGASDTAPLPVDLLLRRLDPMAREVSIQALVLRLLGDYCLLYNNTVGLLLKRDSEVVGHSTEQRGHHHHQHHATPGPAAADTRTPASGRRTSSRLREHSSSGGQAGAESQHKAGVVLKHIMHVQLVDQLPPWGPSANSVPANASALLQAVCIRSAEGRRRILHELVSTLNSSIQGPQKQQPAAGAQDQAAASTGPLPATASACIALMGALVTSNSTLGGRSDPRQASSSAMSLEVVRAMREAGAVKALAQALKLINTEHAKARDAINAILKPLEVLTRPLHKLAAADAAAAGAAAGEQAADTRAALDQGTAAAAAAPAAAGAAGAAAAAATPSATPGTASRQRGQAAATGAAGQPAAAGRAQGTAATAGSAAAAAAAAAGASAGAGGAAAGAAQPAAAAAGGSGGGNAPMDEDRRQQAAGEEAAGPAALAAAGRFVPGGVPQGGGAGGGAGGAEGALLDNLMAQMVDIEVDLSGDSDGLDEDESEEDGLSSEEEGGSDEHMQGGMAGEEAGEEAAGGSSEGAGMDEDPSLTEEDDSSGDEPHSDDDGEGHPVFIAPGDVAGAHEVVDHHADGLDLDQHSDDSITDEDDEDDDEGGGHGGHHHAFDEEAALLEDELHLMQQGLNGAPQEDGVVPMDDEEEEEEEEEEEYLDDEASDDQWAMDDTLAPWGWEGGPGGAPPAGAGGSRWTTMHLQDSLFDDLPPLPSMRVDFGRLPGGRRMQGLRMGGTPAAAAGVWDDAGDGLDGLPDPIMSGPLGTVQMMLNQLGLQAGALAGSSDRRFRWMYPGGVDPSEQSAAATGASGAAADGSSSVRTVGNLMQTLTSQLLPQQHRLLALPPRVAATESAALLEQAANLQPQRQQQHPEGAAPAAPAAAGAAAAAAAGASPADASLRSQAGTVSTLSRLVFRMNEAAAPSSNAYLRDGRISVRHPVSGGLINVAINPTLLSPGMGPGSSLWQTLEALSAPNGLLAAGGQGPGMGGLADDSVWDEAVTQLLEVLAPNGTGRSARLPTAGLAPPGAAGRAAAAGAADNAGLDPRSLESHMTALLRAQAPAAPAAAPEQPAAAAARRGQPVVPPAAAAAPAAGVAAAAATAEAAQPAGQAAAGTPQAAAAPAADAAAGSDRGTRTPSPAQQAGQPQPPPAPSAVRARAAAEARPAGTQHAAAGPVSAAAAAGGAAAARRPAAITEDFLANALRAALDGDTSAPAPAAAGAAAQPADGAGPSGAAQQQQQQHDAAVQRLASHPVDVATSAGGSPTAAGAAAAAAGGLGADEAAPMDTDAAEQQQQAGAGEPDQAAGGGPTAMEAEPSAGAAAAAAAGDPMQAALRRAAEEAGIDWAFLEALPEELRVEVLSAQGVELRLPQPAGALPAAAAAAPPASAEPAAAAAAAPAAGEQPASQQAATAEAAAAGEAPAPAAAAAGEGGVAAAAAGDAPAPAAAADADGGAAPAAAAAAAPAPAAAAAPPEEPEIDPEFLAALPDDIRQEVLAQQRAEQRARAAAARAAEQNRQPDMSLADLLAAMPDDVRQDALAQLSDTDLAQLPPQTRAEAVALRENAQRAMRQMQAAQQAQQQAAQQQHEMFLQQNLPGGAGRGLRLAGAPPLSLAVGPDGLPVAARMFGTGGLRAALGNAGRLGGRDLANATAAARAANAAAEPEGPPPLDESDLAVLISLLRTSLPLSKQHLQKLLLNLAAHSSSREQLLSMLLSLLRSLPGTSAVEGGTDADAAPDEASDSMQTGTSGRAAGMDISEDGSSQQQQQQQQQQPSQGLSAALDKLGSAQEQAPADAGGAGSAAPAADGTPGAAAVGLSGSPQGKPAVVSRRVLDMLSYLCRNSSPVSRKMLSLRIPEPDAQAAALEADAKGKGKMVVPSSDADTAAPQAPRAVEVLLAMLSAPLCQRSVSLLEQLMLLMEVVLTMVARHEADLAALAALEEAQEQQREAEAERKRQREQQQQQAAAAAAEQPAAAAAQPAEQPAAAAGAAAEPGQQQEAAQQAAGAAEPAAAQQQQQQDQSSIGAAKAKEQEQKQKQKQQQPPSELATTLASLPPNLLRQLPGLLAREVLSEPAYASIAKVIKLIVEAAPVHLPLMLSELVEGAAGVADALLSFLDTAAQRGIDADAQLAPAIGTKSSVVLRMLYALQGFQAEVQERLKQQKEQQQKEQQQKEQQQQQEAASGAAAAGTTSGAAGAAATGSGGNSSAAATAGPSSSRAAAAGSAGASSSAAAAAAAAGTAGLDASGAAAEVDKAVASIAARTAPLWKSLSSCILRIEDNLRAVLPQHTQAGGESVGSAAARLLPPGAQQVLPLVEAFFVLCALQGAIPAAAAPAKDLLSAPSMDLNALMPSTSSGGAAGAAAAAAGTPSAGGTAAAGGGAASGLWRPSSMSLGEAGASTPGAAAAGDGTLPFLKFAERHRRLLNAYIRRNTSLLESSLAPLLRVPKLIDFDNKRAYFRSKVRSPDERMYGSLRLNVKRTSVFEDSFNKLRSKSPAEMRAKLSVAFVGEEGIDAGGVSREWYQVMAREIFNPNLALFVSVPEGGTTFQPNPNSIVQNDTGVSHLEFFKFVGRVVGKALYDGQLMDAYFTRSFYKHMLGQPLTYEDIEAVDPEYYKNLKWMLENDITDVLDLTFTAESDFFGKTEVVELVPGGRDIRVTEANKREYVNLIARHRMTTSIKAQIQAFLEGFWQLVPRELIAIFNDHELELLISGLPDIDVGDLRANTQYSGYSPASTVIQWFWQVVADMEKQDLALLLQFVTGTSKVPLNGFKALQGISGPQRFQIHKSYGAGDRLPSAHTCFNQLDLPEYDSKEQLAERLMMAIHEGHEGFGFG